MRIIYFISFCLAIVLIQSCSDKNEKNSPEKKSSAKIIPKFKWTTVTAAQPSFSITLPGELKPYEEVNIFPKIKGFVKRIYVDRGSYVRKGQLLAVLEAPEVGAQFSAKTSTTSSTYQKFLFSKQSYYRLKEAAKKNGAVATIEVERAYAQYLGDSAAYRSSRAEANASGQLQNYLQIRAPFSGVITGRFTSEGALVGDAASGTPLFQLTQERRLRLIVAIPEKQAQALSAQTKATFSVIDYPGKIFTAMLSRNSGALDARTKSLIAEFDMDNNNGVLRAGQYARVSLDLQRKQPTLWVPKTSVVQAPAGVFVIKNDSGTTRRLPVQIGVTKDSLVEVFGNLKPGDQILLKGSEEVKEGIRIAQQK